jgi:hypothetical protein
MGIRLADGEDRPSLGIRNRAGELSMKYARPVLAAVSLSLLLSSSAVAGVHGRCKVDGRPDTLIDKIIEIFAPPPPKCCKAPKENEFPSCCGSNSVC